MQEEAQPAALAAPLAPDPVHAVVPVAAAEQRQPVGAGGDRLVDGAQTVLEERARFGGDRGLQVGLVGALVEQRRGEERHALVEHRRVAGHSQVARDGERQPEQVVRAAGARALARRRVPPVLDVPLDELAAGRAQQVLAREIGARQHQRHRVLQLVAEAEGAAGLRVPRPRPHPAATASGTGASRSSPGRRSRPASSPAPPAGCPPSRAAPRRAPPRPRRRWRSERAASAPRRRPRPGRARTPGGASRRASAPPPPAARRRGRARRRGGRRAAGGRGRPAPPASRCGRGTPRGRR